MTSTSPLARTSNAHGKRLWTSVSSAPAEASGTPRPCSSFEPGHRVFAYIPKGNGVGGYVGVGEVTGKTQLAKDFTVQSNGRRAPYLEVTTSPGASQHLDDPALAEWVVPVTWLKMRSREDAVRDSDFFANQNSAVKLTHGYTLERLSKEFEV